MIPPTFLALLAKGLVKAHHLGFEGGGVEDFADGGVEGVAVEEGLEGGGNGVQVLLRADFTGGDGVGQGLLPEGVFLDRFDGDEGYENVLVREFVEKYGIE